MFRKPVYVFKDGNEIVKNGKINNFFKTKTQALNLSYDKNIKKYINKWIGKQYSLNTDDLSVDENYFRSNNFNFH
jgi:formylmethanofuran dehydrogenase subunit A